MPHHNMNGSVRNKEILRPAWKFQIYDDPSMIMKSTAAFPNITESHGEQKQYIGCEPRPNEWHWTIDIKFLNALIQRSHTTLDRRINRTAKDQWIDRTEEQVRSSKFYNWFKRFICWNSLLFSLSFKYGDPGTDLKFRLHEVRDEPGIKTKIYIDLIKPEKTDLRIKRNPNQSN